MPTYDLPDPAQAMPIHEFTPEPPEEEDGKPSLPEFIAKLEARRYDESNPPPIQPPLVNLSYAPVLWRGNVHTLVSGSKVGKTRVLAGMMSVLSKGGRKLGWNTPQDNDEEFKPLKAIYLDFEQDAEDFYDAMKNQAGVGQKDVYAYNLSGFNVTEALLSVEMLLEEHDDAAMLLLDGIADLCANVNDPEEANALVSKLMDLSRKHNIAILGVLHLNPGSESKSRGHLGSQLERKSKTIIQIDADEDGSRTIYLKIARKKPLLKKDGVRFKWDDSIGGFAEMEFTKNEERRMESSEELRGLAEAVFSLSLIGNLSHGELIEAIIKETGKSKATAKRKIREMKDFGIVSVKNAGKYEISEGAANVVGKGK